MGCAAATQACVFALRCKTVRMNSAAHFQSFIGMDCKIEAQKDVPLPPPNPIPHGNNSSSLTKITCQGTAGSDLVAPALFKLVHFAKTAAGSDGHSVGRECGLEALTRPDLCDMSEVG